MPSNILIVVLVIANMVWLAFVVEISQEPRRIVYEQVCK